MAFFDWRHTYGDAQIPGFFNFQTGSLWATEASLFEWDPYFAVFFWEQWLKKDRFVIRIGQLTANSVFDNFRFSDPRTQYSNSQLTFPAATIPLGPPALGLIFKWWPIENSELYIVGTIIDINGPPPSEGRIDWSGIFETGEVLAGLEVGYNWKRSKNDFDHLHLNFWYADSASKKDFGSDSGTGWRINGQKQFNDLVLYAIYSNNNALGGGFGFTNSSHTADIGLGYLNPLNIKGEILFGASWGSPLDKPDPYRGIISNRDQFSVQANWRLLLTPDFYFTPGAQLVFNPSFNPNVNSIFIPQAKFRLFF